MQRQVFHLSEEQIELLRLYADYRDRPMAEIVRAALDLFFDRQALRDPHVAELVNQVRRGQQAEEEK